MSNRMQHNTKIIRLNHPNTIKRILNEKEGVIVAPLDSTSSMSVLSPALRYLEPEYDVDDIINLDTTYGQYKIKVTNVVFSTIYDYCSYNHVKDEEFYLSSGSMLKAKADDKLWAWFYSFKLIEEKQNKQKDKEGYTLDINIKVLEVITATCNRCGSSILCNDEKEFIFDFNDFNYDEEALRDYLRKEASKKVYKYCPNCGNKI